MTMLSKIRSIRRPLSGLGNIHPKRMLLKRRGAFPVSSSKKRDGLLRSKLNRVMDGSQDDVVDLPWDDLSVIATDGDDDDDDRIDVGDKTVESSNTRRTPVEDGELILAKIESSETDAKTPLHHNSSRRPDFLSPITPLSPMSQRGGFGSKMGTHAEQILSNTVDDTMEFVDARLLPTAMDATKNVAKYVIPAMKEAIDETLRECVRDLGQAFRNSSNDLGTSVQALGTSVEHAMNDVGNILGTSIESAGRPAAHAMAEESVEWRHLVGTIANTAPSLVVTTFFHEIQALLHQCLLPLLNFAVGVLAPSYLLVAADLYRTDSAVRNETRCLVLVLIIVHWLTQQRPQQNN